MRVSCSLEWYVHTSGEIGGTRARITGCCLYASRLACFLERVRGGRVCLLSEVVTGCQFHTVAPDAFELV